jgi:hypothetical protein
VRDVVTKKKRSTMKTKNTKEIYWALALTVCVLPAACDRLGNGLGSGEKVAVSLSFGGLEPWGAETVVRGASTAPVERTSVALEDNWVLVADLVEEPAVPTRVGVSSGAILRVVAIDGSNQIADEKSYVCQSNGSFEPGAGGPIMVEPGSYGILAYAYNAVSPAMPTSAGTTVLVTPYVDGTATNDLITTNGTVSVTVGGGGSGPDLTLEHRFSRVKYSANIASGVPVVINSVSLWNDYPATLDKTDGGLDEGTAVEQPLDDTDPRIVYTAGKVPKLKVLGEVNGVAFTRYLSYTTALEAGKSYTLQINVKKGRWAGSNVYWDGSMLTFKEAGYVGNENYYQGVAFRWGSLVGATPAATWTDGYSFHPGTDGLPDGEHIYVYHDGQWRATNLATAVGNSYPGFGLYSTFSNIPAITLQVPGNYDEDNLGSTFSDNTGDICRFIGEHGGPRGYRMPKASEFFSGNTVGTYYWGNPEVAGWSEGGSFTQVVPSDPTGRQVLDPSTGAGYVTNDGATFPTSGGLDTAGGPLGNGGGQGFYWSSSNNSGGNTYFFIIGSKWMDVNIGNWENGWFVRCILD